MGLLALTFAAPAALLGLAALPLVYLLLRITPPPPRRVVFPPVRLLLDLMRKEETPARTPWPLLVLRLAIAACAILAMAGPAWSPFAAPFSSAPVLLAIDDGWPTAPSWSERVAAAVEVARNAGRAGAPVALLIMSRAESEPALESAATIEERLRALRPAPLIPDRGPAARKLSAFAAAHPGARVVWIADGLEQGEAQTFVSALKEAQATGAGVEVLAWGNETLALAAPANRAGGLEVEILRSGAGASAQGQVLALDEQGRTVSKAEFGLGAERKARIEFELPMEIRNDVVSLRLAGVASAGAVALLDGRSKARRVGLVSAVADVAQPLLAPQHYLQRALAPFADARLARAGAIDPISALLDERPNMLVLADVGVVSGEAYRRLANFVEDGGVLLRFSGPRLANASDDLIPVRLRRADRVLGGALSWEAPKKLAPFEPASPFFGLTVPEEVAVTRQVLAEPEAGLSAKTWAHLADGTPLVTAERRGKGLIVLFHVNADPAWSNLPISGLFVEMLHRISSLGAAAAPQREEETSARVQEGTLAPLRSLDGFGALTAPPLTAKPIAPDFSATPSREHPPGFYGPAEAPVAVQTLPLGADLRNMDYASLGLRVGSLRFGAPLDLRPLFLALVFAGLLLDIVLALAMTGRLRFPAPGRGAQGILGALAVLVLISGPPPASAKEAQAGAFSERNREAALQTRLAYVVTGDARVDETSRLGLEALSRALAQRTSLAPGDPVGVDPARDELAFYPMLYWPIVATAAQPSAQAAAKTASYMKLGGAVVFDTRDALVARAGAGLTPERRWLREFSRNLDLPELEVVSRDHVITKTFYLLDGFYGRTTDGETWVEALPPEPNDGALRPVRAGDSVSPVVITSNDLAAGWATDRSGAPLYLLIPGGARQRELALRGGINLVMYTLTGNYKSDQVHVRDLLERLGQ